MLAFGCKEESSHEKISQPAPSIQDHNLIGSRLTLCSTSPLTGFYRTGYCESRQDDAGLHTICVKMNDAFLKFNAQLGNDLITPNKEQHFPGLKAGDYWCVCADWWQQAILQNIETEINLHASNSKSLQIIDPGLFEQYGISPNLY